MFVQNRKRTFIDRPVQGQLMVRALMYWALCMTGIFMLLAGTPIVVCWFVNAAGVPTAGEIILQTMRMFWPVFFASALVLPFLLLDVLRVSHRFAGPMLRLKNALRDVADGKPVAPIKFREGDFWWEMAEEFNRVAARMQELEPARLHEQRADGTIASLSQPANTLAS